MVPTNWVAAAALLRFLPRYPRPPRLRLPPLPALRPSVACGAILRFVGINKNLSWD